MLFNSYEFIFLFLPITFFIYFYLNAKRLTEASKAFLVFASLFFYTWWSVAYLPIILSSMLFNYVIGFSIFKNQENRKASKELLLLVGIISDVALLAYFKYADFFIANINVVTEWNLPLLHLSLPLAISFFTFTQIAFLVDTYKGKMKELNFVHYALFVTYFPHLIAGPVLHHKEMMPQFSRLKNKVKNYKNIAMGLFIFSIGIFKKVVIADTFAIWAIEGFDKSETLTLIEAWATSLSYTFQLYFDFSGYTDMAIGSSLLFNIWLPINFNSPYKALNIQDFWRRWHITLSRFLRDYIYIPLGGNRKGDFKTCNNLMITFLIGGLWHGAGWTFIFLGFLHGLALVIHRVWQQFSFKMNTLLAWIITFNFLNITWVFFRAREWNDAKKVFLGMFNLNKVGTINDFINFGNLTKIDFLIMCLCFLFALFSFFTKNSNEMLQNFNIASKKTMAIGVFSLSIAILSSNKISEFLYFNF